MYKYLGKIGAFLYVAAIVAVSVIFTVRDANRNYKKEVTIEAGSKIRIEDFFNNCPDDARFVTDVSSIDTNIPAVYQLRIFYDEAFEKDVILRIEDHTGPKGVALPKSLYSSWKMPDAADCVGYLYDLSGIAKIEFKNGAPSFSESGTFNVPVAVTDVYGNETVIDVPFTVIYDVDAPVIRGVMNIESNGDPNIVDYFGGVWVFDDTDEEPILTVDDSKVDYEQEGEYEIIYRAVDKAGNTSTVKAKLTVIFPVEEETATDNSFSDIDYEDQGIYSARGKDAYGLAAGVMAGLWRGNDVETARAIFNWCHSHIYYQVINGRQTYEGAAYRGFTKHSGDCYVYFACAKMLLDCAGIPNMMVRRSPVTRNGHYWHLVYLNGEWWHCDSTVFRNHPGVYFMLTDDQIRDSNHQFDGSLYPMRAGGSTEYKPSDTPTPTIDPNATPTPDPNATTAPVPTVSVTPSPSGNATVTPSPSDVKDSPTPTPENTNTDTPTPTEAQATPSDTPTPTPPPKETDVTETTSGEG